MSGNKFGNRLRTTVDSAMQRSLEAGGAVSPARLSLAVIQPNPDQPRRYFDPERLAELTASIQEQGVLQPIMVRPVENGRYLIVFGERRYQAALAAGLSEIPVIISDLKAGEAELLAAIENLQREDLSAYEKASYTLLLVARELEMPQEEVPAYLRYLHRNAGKAGADINPEHISRLEALFRELGGSWRTFAVHGLRVLNLSDLLKTALQQGQLDYTKALLIQTTPPEYHAELLQAVQAGISLSELQQRIQSQQAPRPTSIVMEVKRRLTEKTIQSLPEKSQKRIGKLLDELNGLLRGE